MNRCDDMDKIIFLLHTYSVGGAERRCVAIANYLALKGVRVKLALLDVDKMYKCHETADGLSIRLVDSPRTEIPVLPEVEVDYLLHKGESSYPDERIISFPYSADDKPLLRAEDYYPEALQNSDGYRRQLRELEELYIDRIYHYVKQFPDYAVISWMTFCNIATAVALHSLPNRFAFVECTNPGTEFEKDSVFNGLKRRFYPRADAAFFQTAEIRDHYSYLADTEKYVIPNPMMLSLPDKYTGPRRKCIVNFCRIEKPKNLDHLIEAFALFRRDYPDYQLHIFGEGQERSRLQRKVALMRLEGAVRFFSYTANVHSLVADYAMFVSSSTREGISNSMMEAMAIGLPCICTDCRGGGARAVINNGHNGLLVPVNDVDALCRAMKKLVADDGLAPSLSKEAVKVRDEYSIDRIGMLWDTALTKMLATA